MEPDASAKISQILQLTVMKICQSVVEYTNELTVQGVVSVEADGKDICTVTFSDSEEVASIKNFNTGDSKEMATQAIPKPDGKHPLDLYMKDAEKDGYESDVSDTDRMVIDEKTEGKSKNCIVENPQLKDSLKSEQDSLNYTNKRKINNPVKQDVDTNDIAVSQSGNYSEKEAQKDLPVNEPVLNPEKGEQRTNVDVTNNKIEKVMVSNVKKEILALRHTHEKNVSKSNKCKVSFENCDDNKSTANEDLILRPPEVPESPSQKLSGNERSLVNSLVAKALKLWYDDDTPGGAMTDSPRRGFLSLSPRGRGAFELLHSPTSPLNLAKNSKETVSKALLFTADSEIKQEKPTSMETAKSMFTTARLKSMLKERAENKKVATSVSMPIDEQESASLMQFASALPGWIPLASLSSPEDILQFQQLNKSFLHGEKQEQHSLHKKSFTCQLCLKTFVHSANLTRHMRNIHGQLPRQHKKYQNDLSGKTSNTSSPNILQSALRENKSIVENSKVHNDSRTTSDTEAAQILSSMRELVARDAEAQNVAQKHNNLTNSTNDAMTATENGSTTNKVVTTTNEDVPMPPRTELQLTGKEASIASVDSTLTVEKQPPGHPDAFPLSNSPKKEKSTDCDSA